MFYMTLFQFLILRFSLENFLVYVIKYLFIVSLACIISGRSTLKQVLLSNFPSFLSFASSFWSLDGRLDVRSQLIVFSFLISSSVFLIASLSFTIQMPILYQVETSSYFFALVLAFCSVIFWLFLCFLLNVFWYSFTYTLG